MCFVGTLQANRRQSSTLLVDSSDSTFLHVSKFVQFEPDKLIDGRAELHSSGLSVIGVLSARQITSSFGLRGHFKYVTGSRDTAERGCSVDVPGTVANQVPDWFATVPSAKGIEDIHIPMATRISKGENRAVATVTTERCRAVEITRSIDNHSRVGGDSVISSEEAV